MSAVAEHRAITNGQPTQPCPACEGTMPAGSVQATRWARRAGGEAGPYLQRTVSMECPHCGHKAQRSETKPLRWWL